MEKDKTKQAYFLFSSGILEMWEQVQNEIAKELLGPRKR